MDGWERGGTRQLEKLCVQLRLRLAQGMAIGFVFAGVLRGEKKNSGNEV